jgi:7-cyano-7-deazaguanine synthase
MSNKKFAVLSLSGGLDSSTLLLHLLANDYRVIALSFDYGQKHKVELEKAKELVDYINSNIYNSTIETPRSTLSYMPVKHQIIKIDGLDKLLVSGLVDNDSMEMKKGHYAHENALTTVVPNRNAIFSSITYAVALSVVKRENNPCIIALGTHMGDFDNKKQSGIYPDCSEEFKQAIEHAFKVGNWDSDKVDYYAPYNVTDKTGVLKDGVKCCEKLGLDYKEIYKRTNTSYAPVLGKDGNQYSDIYTGSSVERVESFIKLGLEDPLQYAENDGTLVSWNYVKEKVEQICKEWESSKDNG